MRGASLRRLLLVLCVLVSASMAGIGATADEFENLAQNGDFEDGTVGWDLRQDEGAAATMEEDDEEAIKGDLCVFVDIDSVAGTSAWHLALFQDGHTIENGEEYTFAIWLKAEEARPVTLYVEKQADPWDGYGRKDFTLTQEWQECWINFTAPVTFAVWLRVALGLSDVSIWADNARFFIGGYVEDEEEDVPQIAVDPAGKSAVTWAEIKSSH